MIEPAPQTEAQEGEEEVFCRFCYDKGEPGRALVSPCKCVGSQRFVHLQCLQRWQSQTLLSAASHEVADTRHATVCSVCQQGYSTPLPERALLLAHVRAGGAELARMLQPGTLLVASPSLGDIDLDEITQLPGWLRAFLQTRRSHWVQSVYLLIDVRAGEGGDGSDALIGVNLTARRPELGTGHRTEVKRLVAMDGVQCFVGGPCDRRLPYAVHNFPEVVAASQIPFEEETASIADVSGTTTNSAPNIGNEEPQNMEINDEHDPHGVEEGGSPLPDRGDVISEVPPHLANTDHADPVHSATAMTLLLPRYSEVDALKELLECTLETSPPTSGITCLAPGRRIKVFEGHAQWSRTQLQNEVARGDWGLCKARAHEVFPAGPDPETEPENLWRTIMDTNRALFASSPL